MGVFLFDLTATQPNSDGFYHGGGKYAKKIFLSLVDGFTSSTSLLGMFDSTKHLDEDIIAAAKEKALTLIDINEHKSIQSIVAKYGVQKFYSALPYYIPELKDLKCDVIGTVHGLRELETQPDRHSLLYFDKPAAKIKAAGKWLLKNYILRKKITHFRNLIGSIKIITVSNHTKYSIMAHFPDIQAEQISVFYSPDVTNDQAVINDTSFTEKDFFLMISGNRWIKNNLRSAMALDQLFTERSDIKNNAVITGVSNVQLFLKHLKNKDRFIFFKYVDEAFLSQLYKKAFALMYMTLNEGFGYPPLEAMKESVPVIASPFTSITEICGNAVLYANPTALDEIKNRVLQLFDNGVYNTLQKEGLIRYNHISEIQHRDLLSMLKYLLEE